MTVSEKRYPPQDPIALGHHYHAHVNALTDEGLHGKAEIAEQLAWRDQTIEHLRAELASERALRAELSTIYREEHKRIAPLLAAAAKNHSGEWLYCPRHCRVDGEPVRLVPGQRCPECREVALF